MHDKLEEPAMFTAQLSMDYTVYLKARACLGKGIGNTNEFHKAGSKQLCQLFSTRAGQGAHLRLHR